MIACSIASISFAAVGGSRSLLSSSHDLLVGKAGQRDGLVSSCLYPAFGAFPLDVVRLKHGVFAVFRCMRHLSPAAIWIIAAVRAHRVMVGSR